MTKLEKARANFQKWYQANREEYNALRRMRYAKTPAVKKKARTQAAKYREERRAGRFSERPLFREVNGIPTRVYTLGQVSEITGIPQQTLRNWEAKNRIPPTVFPGTHRLYLKHQVQLLRVLAERMNRARTRQDKSLALYQWRDTVIGKW
jgi:hypothetical protein